MKRFLGQKQLVAIIIFFGETVIPAAVGEPISVSILVIKGLFLVWELKKPHQSESAGDLKPLHPSEPATGLVTETIYPPKAGRVSAFGTVWPARCQQPIVLSPGTIVEILGWLDPVTLLVQVRENTPPPALPVPPPPDLDETHRHAVLIDL